MPDPLNPQALNRYSYVINNPLIYIDPTGYSWLEDIWEDFKEWWSKHVNVNVNVSVSTDSEGNMNISNPSTGEPFSRSSGPSNSSYSSYLGDSGGGYGYGSSGGDTFNLTIVNDFSRSNYDNISQPSQDSINRDMMPAKIRHQERDESPNDSNVDWKNVILSGGSSILAITSIAVPPLRFAGYAFTAGAVTYGYIKYKRGDISLGQFGVDAALTVSPLFGKGIGKFIGKKIAPDAVEAIDAAFDVYGHQLGIFGTGKNIFYDPNK